MVHIHMLGQIHITDIGREFQRQAIQSSLNSETAVAMNSVHIGTKNLWTNTTYMQLHNKSNMNYNTNIRHIQSLAFPSHYSTVPSVTSSLTSHTNTLHSTNGVNYIYINLTLHINCSNFVLTRVNL